MLILVCLCLAIVTLNESPSEKEGKFSVGIAKSYIFWPSMKVPPKRKGNR